MFLCFLNVIPGICEGWTEAGDVDAVLGSVSGQRPGESHNSMLRDHVNSIKSAEKKVIILELGGGGGKGQGYMGKKNFF